MNESDNKNNVVSVDFKNKKKIATQTEPVETTNKIMVSDNNPLEEQPLPLKVPDVLEDSYKKFVTDPVNSNKIEFIIVELIKTISSEYPEITTCRFADILLLKECVISLLMRSLLNQNHPFHNMADGLEKAYKENEKNGFTK